MRFRIVVKDQQRIIAEFTGKIVELNALDVGDVTQRVVETEQYLNRVLGLRVHILSEM